MDGSGATIGAGFVAGILSFLSPCVFPLVPGYVSYLAGVSLEDVEKGVDKKTLLVDVIGNAFVFVLGFSTVFILLGAAASAAGDFVYRHLPMLIKVGGVFVILMGAHLAHLLPIRGLYREFRLNSGINPSGYLGSFLVGNTFALGWTPCIGPILGSILALASTAETLREGVLLLTVYSAGLGIPFILTGALIGNFFGSFKKMRRYVGLFERISGVLLMIMGVLLLSGKLGWLASKLSFLDVFAR